MKLTRALLLSLVSTLVVACSGGSQPGGGLEPDAATKSIDAPAAVIRLPTWSLTDVQPVSPRTGQTYGLAAFTNKIIVVSLLEGF